MINLEGRIAVVTGGGMGIGAGISKVLSGYGATIAIADINPDTAEPTRRAMQAVAPGDERVWQASLSPPPRASPPKEQQEQGRPLRARAAAAPPRPSRAR